MKKELKKEIKREIIRKVIHITSLSFFLIVLYSLGKLYLALLMFIAFLFIYPISYKRIKNPVTWPFWWILELAEREKNMKTLPARQSLSLILGVFVVSLLFNEKIITVSIISLAIYDSVANLVGKFWGKRKFFGNRTIEGSILGIIINSIALSFILTPWVAILISFVVAGLELISPSKGLFDDDNFVIPVGTAIFTWFLSQFIQI